MCVYKERCSEGDEGCNEINNILAEEPTCFYQKPLKANKEPVAEVPCSAGVISPPSLMAMITSLMGKVNRVTSQHRHGLKVSDSALTRLSNKQIELEELMEELGL